MNPEIVAGFIVATCLIFNVAGALKGATKRLIRWYERKLNSPE